MAFFCKHCGAPVRHLADHSGVVHTCEAKKITIYTDRGRRAEGYKLHECKRSDDNKREDGCDYSPTGGLSATGVARKHPDRY
jgi:hypothetical protein